MRAAEVDVAIMFYLFPLLLFVDIVDANLDLNFVRNLVQLFLPVEVHLVRDFS